MISMILIYVRKVFVFGHQVYDSVQLQHEERWPDNKTSCVSPRKRLYNKNHFSVVFFPVLCEKL